MDAFGVVAELFVELRELADATFDVIRLRPVAVIEKCDVNLHRGCRLTRQLVFVSRSQDGLRTDHEHVVVTSDARGTSKDVRQLGAVHRAAVARWSRSVCRIFVRRSVESTPAKGEFSRSSRDRSSVAFSASMMQSRPPSKIRSHRWR